MRTAEKGADPVGFAPFSLFRKGARSCRQMHGGPRAPARSLCRPSGSNAIMPPMHCIAMGGTGLKTPAELALTIRVP